MTENRRKRTTLGDFVPLFKDENFAGSEFSELIYRQCRAHIRAYVIRRVSRFARGFGHTRVTDSN
jgi:hypothetical protein